MSSLSCLFICLLLLAALLSIVKLTFWIEPKFVMFWAPSVIYGMFRKIFKFLMVTVSLCSCLKSNFFMPGFSLIRIISVIRFSKYSCFFYCIAPKFQTWESYTWDTYMLCEILYMCSVEKTYLILIFNT